MDRSLGPQAPILWTVFFLPHARCCTIVRRLPSSAATCLSSLPPHHRPAEMPSSTIELCLLSLLFSAVRHRPPCLPSPSPLSPSYGTASTSFVHLSQSRLLPHHHRSFPSQLMLLPRRNHCHGSDLRAARCHFPTAKASLLAKMPHLPSLSTFFLCPDHLPASFSLAEDSRHYLPIPSHQIFLLEPSPSSPAAVYLLATTSSSASPCRVQSITTMSFPSTSSSYSKTHSAACHLSLEVLLPLPTSHHRSHYSPSSIRLTEKRVLHDYSRESCQSMAHNNSDCKWNSMSPRSTGFRHDLMHLIFILRPRNFQSFKDQLYIDSRFFWIRIGPD